MPTIEVNIEIYCETCGEGICNLATATKTRNHQEPCFRIEPCPKCLEKARDEGDSKGYDRGLADGILEGRAEAESEREEAR